MKISGWGGTSNNWVYNLRKLSFSSILSNKIVKVGLNEVVSTVNLKLFKTI